MKKIGFVTTPLTSGHAIRGVGFYTKRLLPHLKAQASKYNLEILDSNFESCDLIHYPYFDLFTHTLPILKTTKTIVTIHDVIYLEFPDHYPPGLKGLFNLQLQKLSLSNVDRVITDSYASVKSIKKFLNVPDEKIKLVYLAADSIFKKVKSPKNKFSLPKKFVLYVGDVNYNKNIANLIIACEKIDMPLVIVGKQALEVENLSHNTPSGPRDLLRKLLNIPHPQLAHITDLEERFKSKKIIRLGFVSDEDLVDIYNLATVYCQPSLSEGFGLPVLEALSCGTAVACSNRSSLPEIAGEAATYFDPTDPNLIADAIQMASPKGSQDQARKFSWEKAADETLLTYQEVI